MQFAIADGGMQPGFCARANERDSAVSIAARCRGKQGGVDGGDCPWNLPENPALLDLLCREVNSKLRLS